LKYRLKPKDQEELFHPVLYQSNSMLAHYNKLFYQEFKLLN
jgi:hypothetical protein